MFSYFSVADVFNKEHPVINVEDFLDIDMGEDANFDDGLITIDVSGTSASTDDIKDEVITIRDSPILENAVDGGFDNDDVIVIRDDSDEVLDTITRFPTLGSMCGMSFDFESFHSDDLIYLGTSDSSSFSTSNFKEEN